MFIALDICVIIFFVAILQSVFGVGVLLVGTPILMLFGYPYFEVLSLTLPTSFVISVSQVSKYYNDINWALVKRALYFTIPMIPIGMIFAGYLGTMVGIIMGVFLMLTSFNFILKKILPPNATNGRLSVVLFFMGLIHGTTNLGGDILPSVVNQKCSLKEQKLATTAAIYIMFQLTQITFILIKKYPVDVSNSGICVLIGFFAYAIVGKRLFKSFKSENYTKHLRTFIRLVAMLLITIKIYNLKK
jgi:uncharacterized membrane protein YfcA